MFVKGGYVLPIGMEVVGDVFGREPGVRLVCDVALGDVLCSLDGDAINLPGISGDGPFGLCGVGVKLPIGIGER